MLTNRDVERINKIIKYDIKYEIKKSNIARTIQLMDTYAYVNQLINNIFRDEEIEDWIDLISNRYLGNINANIDNGNNRIVFYDQIGSTICLGLQYIRALIAKGFEILYIFESSVFTINPNLIKELESNNITYRIYDTNIDSTDKLIDLAISIRKKILDFNPANIIIHSPAFGAFGCIVLNSLKGISRYRIVPGDHHFYLGYKCIDFFIEFRNFGLKVAIEKRSLEKEKLYKLPYYPIIDEFIEFKGFPINTKGKICFAIAGDPYKFHGSDKILEFIKWLLTSHENVLLFYIGRITPSFKSFIKKEHLENSFILLGYRKDFVSTIKNIDILIDSYPLSGGLVCQTAAYFKKPIVSFKTEEDFFYRSVRSVLGAEDINSPISLTYNKDLKEYVNGLISNNIFRESEGERVHSMLQTKEKFDEQLLQILNGTKSTKINIDNVHLDLEKHNSLYLRLQNNFNPTILIPLVNCYGIKLLFKMPYLYSFIIKNIVFFTKRILVQLIKKLVLYIRKIRK